MNMRERQPDPRHRPAGDPADNPDPSGAAALPNPTQDFLNAGSQILRAALSGDSQAFLNASRQQSGQ